MTDKIVYMDSAKQEVNEIVSYFEEMKFEEIFAIGIKDNKIHFKTSGYKDIMQVLGALELIKDHVIKEW